MKIKTAPDRQSRIPLGGEVVRYNDRFCLVTTNPSGFLPLVDIETGEVFQAPLDFVTEIYVGVLEII